MKKQNKMNTQVMLYVVLALLFVFFGTGVYFVIRGLMYPTLNTIPAGCIGIGVFCMGLGAVLFLQADLLKDPKDSFWKTFGLHYEIGHVATSEVLYDKKDIKMQFVADITIGDAIGSGTIMLYPQVLVVSKLQDKDIVANVCDIADVCREKNVLTLTILDKTWVIISENAIRVKVLEDNLNKLRENE